MQEVSKNKMGTAPILPLLAKMALPSMFSMFISSMYNVVDSIFVSRLGEYALSAVTLIFPIMMITLAIVIGFAIGVSSLIARRLGEQRQDAADSAATHGIYIALVSGILFLFIGLFLIEPFVNLYAAEDSPMRSSAIIYGKIVTAGSLGIALQIQFEKILQATGDMIHPMLFQLVGALTNVFLDPILIFGLFGFPKFGIAGAAIATVIGQLAACFYSIYVFMRKETLVKIHLFNFKLSPETLKDIFEVGVPSMIMQSITAVLLSILNSVLIAFSQAAVSVIGVYFKLQSFVFMPVFGLNQGLLPILGYNYGAKNKTRLFQTLKYGLITAICIMGTGTLIFSLFPEMLLSFFKPSPEMIKIGDPALRIISLSFVFAAINIVLSILYQAIGIGKYSLYISLIRQLIVILPLAYIAYKLGRLNMIWAAYPISEIVACVASIGIAFKVYEEKLKYL